MMAAAIEVTEEEQERWNAELTRDKTGEVSMTSGFLFREEISPDLRIEVRHAELWPPTTMTPSLLPPSRQY